MAEDQSNGKESIRWRDIERIALVVSLIGSGMYYYASIGMKIDRMDTKLSQALQKIEDHSRDSDKDRQKIMNLHATLGNPLPCARCMSGNGKGSMQ